MKVAEVLDRIAAVGRAMAGQPAPQVVPPPERDVRRCDCGRPFPTHGPLVLPCPSCLTERLATGELSARPAPDPWNVPGLIAWLDVQYRQQRAEGDLDDAAAVFAVRSLLERAYPDHLR